MATVLVVDDYQANRHLVVSLLDHKGHRALQACDGAEALEIVRSQHPDLVISDILMPTMDGYEFVRQLRADPEVASTAVIFYTAHYHEREARNLAVACGVSRVLAKPCEPADILDAIEQALSGAVAQSRAPPEEQFDREHLRVMTNKLSEKVSELQAANQQLGTVHDINLQLASERNPRVLLERVSQNARELVGSQHVALCVRPTAALQEAFCTFSGMGAEATRAIAASGRDLLAMGELLGPEFALRARNAPGSASGIGLPAGYPPVHSYVMAAIASLDTRYGWICATNKVGGEEFSAEDARALTILGAQVGRIYENGILNAELRGIAAGLRHAQGAARLGHVITGADGSFESFSESLPELIGAEASAVPPTTRAWLALIHPEDREAFRATAIAAGTSGQRREIDYRLRRGDGDWIHIHQLIDPHVGEGHGPRASRWFSTLQDVTHQRVAEEQVRRLNADLERRVVERTAELEAANRELEAFDYSISHDLRGPLGHIQGFSSALIEDFGDKLEPECRRYLELIRAAGERMDELVGELLQLSTTTRGDILRTQVDVTAIAERVVDALRASEPGRNVKAVIAPGLVARADPGLLRVVLENLIGNAWKFTSKRGAALIEVGRDPGQAPGSFFVRDNGAGFDDAHAGKLFEPFRRMHSQSEFKGTGIGLATVKRIIRRHGGQIRAQAKAGEGASFHFSLPD